MSNPFNDTPLVLWILRLDGLLVIRCNEDCVQQLLINTGFFFRIILKCWQYIDEYRCITILIVLLFVYANVLIGLLCLFLAFLILEDDSWTLCSRRLPIFYFIWWLFEAIQFNNSITIKQCRNIPIKNIRTRCQKWFNQNCISYQIYYHLLARNNVIKNIIYKISSLFYLNILLEIIKIAKRRPTYTSTYVFI